MGASAYFYCFSGIILLMTTTLFLELFALGLASGFLADLFVLDQDILAAGPDSLLHTSVLATMVGGDFVYGGEAL